VWCVKDEDQNVLVREEEIKERWREYFDKLFNGSSTKTWMTSPFGARI